MREVREWTKLPVPRLCEAAIVSNLESSSMAGMERLHSACLPWYGNARRLLVCWATWPESEPMGGESTLRDAFVGLKKCK
jgi:hypothetical protein